MRDNQPDLANIRRTVESAKGGGFDKEAYLQQRGDLLKQIDRGYGFDRERCERFIKVMKSHLPEDWVEKWKKGDQSFWTPMIEESVKDEKALWGARNKDVVRRSTVVYLTSVLIGDELVNSDVEQIENVEVVDETPMDQENFATSGGENWVEGKTIEETPLNKKGLIIWGEKKKLSTQTNKQEGDLQEAPNWNMVVKKLRPLLHITSAGKDCVPAVVSWFVALGRDTANEKEVIMCRQEVMRDVFNIRKNASQDVDEDTGWLSDFYLKSVVEGKFRMDNPKTLHLNTSQINNLSPNATRSEQLDEMERAVREEGGFWVNGNEWFDRKPVFAIRNSRRLPGKVVFANPINDYFTKDGFWNDSSHPEENRPIPRVGDSYELIGAHFAMLVDYDRSRCLVLDPQSGMVLEIERKLFDERINSSPKEILIREGVEAIVK